MSENGLINPSFKITQNDVEQFRTHGFLKLRGVFTPKMVEHMRLLSSKEVEPPSDNYGTGFSKLKYDIGNDDPVVLSVMSDPRLVEAMTALTDRSLFYTQGLGFELEQDKSTGFPWHVGTQSFGFQRREDPGYTIWTPLCPIDPQGQRGGMAYISTAALSGSFVYQHINLVTDRIKSRIEAGEKLTYEDFGALKNSLLNSPEMDEVLTHVSTEDAFEPGDALLFDKYVMHRSIPLGRGPIPSRLAYALRFSATDAVYDKHRVEALAYPRRQFNYDVGSPFNDVVAEADGDSIYGSPYFDGTRAARTLAHA